MGSHAQHPSQEEFGLQCLRAPASDTCVIFVHGILSSGAEAWGEPSWPQLLRDEPQFDDVGIYVFSYRTSLKSHTYSIADAADALREHLSLSQLWGSRKLVFVCHSMGGIVVRRLLVANQGKLLDLKTIIGLFLVASPSLGSRDANLITLLSYGLQHTQAASLRFSQSNTSLDELHRDFRALLGGGKLTIVGRELLEDRAIRIKRWLGLRSQVVEPFSASAYFHQPDCEPLRIPGSDHGTIAKPCSPNSLQHRMLKRFLTLVSAIEPRGDPENSKPNSPREDSDDVPKPNVSKAPLAAARGAATLDDVLETAIAPQRLEAFRILQNDPSPEALYEAALALRSGKLLERVLASWLVRRSSNPLAAFMHVASHDPTEARISNAAPWLRFVPNHDLRTFVPERIVESLDLDEVSTTRLIADLYGWSGSTHLPTVDWDDKWSREKFSHYYASSYMHSTWREQSDTALSIIAFKVLESNDAYRSYSGNDVNFFDCVNKMRGIPKANAKVFLTQLRERGATTMLEALLSVLSSRPMLDVLDDVSVLIDRSDSDVSEKAKAVLACLPARNARVRALKRSELAESPAHFAAAASFDRDTSCVPQLGKMLRFEKANEATINAAAALCELIASSPDARPHLKYGALEHPDKLIRCICLIGLAMDSPRKVQGIIADEYDSARNLETFCLAMAMTYTDGPREMLHVLAHGDEREIYPPLLLPTLQNLYRGAMEHASKQAPILRELIDQPDDI